MWDVGMCLEKHFKQSQYKKCGLEFGSIFTLSILSKKLKNVNIFKKNIGYLKLTTYCATEIFIDEK